MAIVMCTAFHSHLPLLINVLSVQQISDIHQINVDYVTI